jgi:hypothetical protein
MGLARVMQDAVLAFLGMLVTLLVDAARSVGERAAVAEPGAVKPGCGRGGKIAPSAEYAAPGGLCVRAALRRDGGIRSARFGPRNMRGYGRPHLTLTLSAPEGGEGTRKDGQRSTRGYGGPHLTLARSACEGGEGIEKRAGGGGTR